MVTGRTDTPNRLIAGALTTLREEGIVGASARVIAGHAGVNQALVFYHFGTVGGLLAAAARQVAEERAEVYGQRLAQVASFSELAAVARVLHTEERESGNLVVLTQLLAGARTEPLLVPVLADNFELLAERVEATIARLIDGTPLEGMLVADELARSASAGFLGLELLDTLTPQADTSLFDALDGLAVLADALLQAGAVETGILRRRLRRG